MSVDKCCVDAGVVAEYKAVGHEEVIGGINTYRVGDAKPVIVIATDAFGYKFIANREVADQFAQRGFTVIVPDLFDGDAVDRAALDAARAAGEDVMKMFVPWFQRHPPSGASAIVQKVVSAIGAAHSPLHFAAYCYGAAVLIPLYSTTEVTSVVLSHPSMLTPADAAAIIKPTLFVCAEIDNAFTAELRGQFQRTLADRSDVEFTFHAGQEHGFSVRGDGSPAQLKAKAKALDEAATFFLQHTKQ